MRAAWSHIFIVDRIFLQYPNDFVSLSECADAWIRAVRKSPKAFFFLTASLFEHPWNDIFLLTASLFKNPRRHIFLLTASLFENHWRHPFLLTRSNHRQLSLPNSFTGINNEQRSDSNRDNYWRLWGWNLNIAIKKALQRKVAQKKICRKTWKRDLNCVYFGRHIGMAVMETRL